MRVLTGEVLAWAHQGGWEDQQLWQQRFPGAQQEQDHAHLRNPLLKAVSCLFSTLCDAKCNLTVLTQWQWIFEMLLKSADVYSLLVSMRVLLFLFCSLLLSSAVCSQHGIEKTGNFSHATSIVCQPKQSKQQDLFIIIQLQYYKWVCWCGWSKYVCGSVGKGYKKKKIVLK